MDSRISPVEKQYHREKLYEYILEKLRESGVDLNQITWKELSPVDQFHVRGLEVSKELAEEAEMDGAKVLDVGCGIGGACRMLAEEYGCEVTGTDLSREYIRCAERLTKLTGTENNIEFLQADALNLPFDTDTFDVVWTQHVQMNVEDKHRFYSQIRKVLKPGGRLVYYDIFKKGEEEIYFPVPWADDPGVSHLTTTDHLHTQLDGLGFKRLQTRDQTREAMDFFRTAFEKIEGEGPPIAGLNLLIGSATPEKLGNVYKALQEGKLELESGIYRV